MSDIAITIEHLSKRYRIGLQKKQHDTLFGTMTSWLRSPLSNYRQLRKLSTFDEYAAPDDVIWALQDVSFEVKHGEVIGIVGRNGAGKSTLLKILSRITDPTSGRVVLDGRVASLLEVGTGFHPELTGRENVYLNGTVLGMSKKEVDDKFDEIVDFSGVEKFLDTPVKRYSSGMRVRLAFSVAAHLDPEILLIDEVLSVGDVSFQEKCTGKMRDVARSGRTVLFVSHNMAAIQGLCSSGCLLEQGRLIMHDEVDKVVGQYLCRSQEVARSVLLVDRVDRSGNGQFRFSSVTLQGGDRRETSVVQSGEDVTITLAYTRTAESSAYAVFRMAFTDMYGQRLFICTSRSAANKPLLLPDAGEVRCRIPRIPLLPGRYSVSIWCKIDEHVADNIENAFEVDVVGGDFFGTGRLHPRDGGSVIVDNTWEVG